MKTTKELAIELGIIRRRKVLSNIHHSNQREHPKQSFSYLVVLDFESTCWKEKYRTQEIIEFPAVLLNVYTGEVESEFHYYVQPQEQPVLSEFCRQLTGITQEQVENGIPLDICLKKFSHWLNFQYKTKKVVFKQPENDQEKYATFVTWSDWDLGTCLFNECKRKQIRRPPQLNSWIDLRAVYRKFYSRKPNGLNGALQDLGIQFEGREHSGLHDSRNTAKLAWRMMCDGCVMNITKTLSGTKESHHAKVLQDIKQLSPTRSPAHKRQKTDNNSKTREHSVKTPKRNTPSGNTHNLRTPKRNTQNVSKHNVRTPKTNTPSRIPLPVSSSSKKVGFKVFEDSSSLSKPSLGNHVTTSKKQIGFQERDLNIKSSHFGNGKIIGSKKSEVQPFKTPSPLSVSTKPAAVQKGFKTPVGSQALSKFKTPVNCMATPSNRLGATPPLCRCGRRAKRRMVQSPGPNLGRFFFTCAVSNYKDSNKTGCGFFMWETAEGSVKKIAHGRSSFTSKSTVMKPFTPILNTPNSCSIQTTVKKNLGVRGAYNQQLR